MKYTIEQLNEQMEQIKDNLQKKLNENDRKILEIASLEEEVRKGNFIDIDITENVNNCEVNGEVSGNNGEVSGNNTNIPNNGCSNNNNKKENTPSSMKILSNQWVCIIEWSINLGNHHFAVTINFPDDYYIHCGTDPDYIYNFYTHINKKLYEYFPSITWFIIISEDNKKSQPHFHLIVAIRNFIDYNHTLKNNLKSRLVRCVNLYAGSYNTSDIDIKVESLLYFKDIKNWVMYLHKDYSI